jgi:hypothetical protein
MAQARTQFVPEQRGFGFVNSFTLPFPAQIRLPLIGEIDLKKVVYGLCGGMCFAALDYYYAGRPVPPYARPEDLEGDYVRYLWDRQLDSLGVTVIPKVIEWMLRSDKDVALRTARYEVPKLRRRLDQGTPVVVALVRARGVSDPTINHQVLVTGYDFDETSRQLKLYLCDPNYPRRATHLNMSLVSPGQGLDAAQSTGERLRALFLIEYRSQPPPA